MNYNDDPTDELHMYNEYDHSLARPLKLPCGGTAYFDHSSGISYRCEDCGTVVGSVGQPPSCREAKEKYDILQRLGARVAWNYQTGKEYVTRDFGDGYGDNI